MSLPQTIYIASGNASKVGEIMRASALVAAPVAFAGVGALGGMPEVTESGATLVENARLKALALRRKCGGNHWICADDTGLFVEALGGAPGIHTARYAGPGADSRKNIEKLLAALKNVPADRRKAEFRCCLLLVAPDGTESVFHGVFKGRIAEEMSGAGGFGYDPIFIPEGYNATVAQLDDDTKNRISHRALAVRAMMEALLGNPRSIAYC
jgi:XTP/dITP diphosphohydrolase